MGLLRFLLAIAVDGLVDFHQAGFGNTTTMTFTFDPQAEASAHSRSIIVLAFAGFYVFGIEDGIRIVATITQPL